MSALEWVARLFMLREIELNGQESIHIVATVAVGTLVRTPGFQLFEVRISVAVDALPEG